MLRLLSTLLLLVAVGCSRATPVRVERLRCDSRDNPLGVADPHPTLSWILRSDRRSEYQSAYQVQVSTAGRTVWDSGKVPSDANHGIDYAGPPLLPHHHYTWRVRTWDRHDHPSSWSKPATWTQGPVSEPDWHNADWIAARTSSPLKSGTPNGYHAAESKDPAEPKWVQLDLGQPTRIDSITLHPAQPNNYQPTTPGFGFPIRFKIEASDDPAFARATSIVDHTAADYPNPALNAPAFPASTTARYVRVTGTRNWLRKDNTACLAFAELSVTSNNVNVALNKPVTAKDSVESAGWGLRGLTDGLTAASLGDVYAAPLLRTTFRTPRKPSRATATICGLGYHELYVNGDKVSDHVLSPGFTAYHRRAQYLMHDVTDHVRRGDNALGVILGGGWYELATPDLFASERAPWTSPPKLRLLLTLEYPDGTVQRITSNPDWKWTTGHITFQCLRAGETHDLRKSKPNWSTAPTNSPDWRPVQTFPPTLGSGTLVPLNLVPQRHPPIKPTATLPAIELTEPKPNVYVYKLSENIAGWARFTTTGTPGQKITLRFSESLNPDGTISTALATHTFGRYQTGELILAGHPNETSEPRFTYHGFQYVQIEGLTRKPRLSDLTGIKVHTALEPTASFTSSSDLLNRTHVMILHTYLANLHSIPTDCPQREKAGWLCDGHISAPHATLNFDARTLYQKWTQDMADAQAPDGSMPSIVPTPGWSGLGHPAQEFQCPWWGGATVLVPWTLYQTYNDTRILADHYDAMRRYVDSLTARATDHLLTFGLGDWLEVGAYGTPTRTPIPLTSTAAYAHYAHLLSQTAALLNKHEDATRYATLSRQIKDAFNRNYLRPDGTYADDSQTAPALALSLDLAPDNRRHLIAQRLLENIARRNTHLSTGLVGTFHLFRALEQLDRPDLAYALLTVRAFPSYAHMLSHGATTLWESWDGQGSRNHPALGSPDLYFYTTLAGIRPTSPGYKTFSIIPPNIPDLASVSATHDTPQGPISCSWTRTPTKLRLTLTIPCNTTAKVHLPPHSRHSIAIDGKRLLQLPHATDILPNPDPHVLTLGSGTYTITCLP